ncbi:unnamed protein product [Prorocentrum cordatum]|uniref:Uncharacterized protein n=1 Tax=Prorocentrum cordatum TaxID=2364126 RepID=A0ABN9RMF9_9DINO|nr:unnamed protein product [Polarella glacialis]
MAASEWISIVSPVECSPVVAAKQAGKQYAEVTAIQELKAKVGPPHLYTARAVFKSLKEDEHVTTLLEPSQVLSAFYDKFFSVVSQEELGLVIRHFRVRKCYNENFCRIQFSIADGFHIPLGGGQPGVSKLLMEQALVKALVHLGGPSDRQKWSAMQSTKIRDLVMLLRDAGQSGRYQTVDLILRRLIEGQLLKTDRDYDVVMRELSFQNRWREAFAMFDEREKRGLELSPRMRQAKLTISARARQWQATLHMFHDIKNRGVTIPVQQYNDVLMCLVDQRSRKWEQALEIFTEMEEYKRRDKASEGERAAPLCRARKASTPPAAAVGGCSAGLGPPLASREKFGERRAQALEVLGATAAEDGASQTSAARAAGSASLGILSRNAQARRNRVEARSHSGRRAPKPTSAATKILFVEYPRARSPVRAGWRKLRARALQHPDAHGASAIDPSPEGRVCGIAEARGGLGDRRLGPARRGQRVRRSQAVEGAGSVRLANHGARGQGRVPAVARRSWRP